MDDMFEMMLAQQQKQEVGKIISCNEKTEKYGLALTEEDVHQLMVCRKDTLKENRRVEFGEGILPDIIYAFCDSDYIDQNNYADTLRELQEIFYLYKNESQDRLTDFELIDFMRKQFDEVCFGDPEYLRGTCLERFARAIREGYKTLAQQMERDEYTLRESQNEYSRFDEEARWEYEIYCKKLDDIN